MKKKTFFKKHLDLEEIDVELSSVLTVLIVETYCNEASF